MVGAKINEIVYIYHVPHSHVAARKLGMQSELHGNVVHHGVAVLLLVSMLFLLIIPKSLLILKEFWYTSYKCDQGNFP